MDFSSIDPNLDIEGQTQQQTTYKLTVLGMMCQKSCASTVENTLRKMSSVTSADASFKEKMVTITLSPDSQLTVTNLIDEVEDIGFEAYLFVKQNTYKLTVLGMMCQKSCASTVENTLRKIPSVISAECSFKEKMVAITLSPDSLLTVANLIEEVEDVGFEASLYDAELSNSTGRRRNSSSGSASASSSSLLSLSFDVAKLSSSTSPHSSSKLSLLENVHDNSSSENDDILFDNNTNPSATFAIEGMSCAVCVGKVERALNSINTVSYAAVSLATCRAKIKFHPISVQEAKDVKAEVLLLVQDCSNIVTKLGYEATVITVTDGSNKDNDDDPSDSLKANSSQLTNAKQKDLNNWLHLLGVSTLFTIPLVAIHYSMMFSARHIDPSMDMQNSLDYRDWFMFILATPVQFYVGRRFYVAAWHGIKAKVLGMDALITMGTSAAYLYSVIAFTLGLFHIGEKKMPTFETGAMLLTFVTVGKFLEAYAKGKTSAALTELMGLQVDEATRIIYSSKDDDTININNIKIPAILSDANQIHNHQSEVVSINKIKVGDYLIVRPGNRIPADGIIVAHASVEVYIDESPLTGESFPVSKRAGSPVSGGCVNQLSVFILLVQAVGSKTMLARIVRLVEDAQSSKAPIQQYAGKCYMQKWE